MKRFGFVIGTTRRRDLARSAAQIRTQRARDYEARAGHRREAIRWMDSRYGYALAWVMDRFCRRLERHGYLVDRGSLTLETMVETGEPGSSMRWRISVHAAPPEREAIGG